MFNFIEKIKTRKPVLTEEEYEKNMQLLKSLLDEKIPFEERVNNFNYIITSFLSKIAKKYSCRYPANTYFLLKDSLKKQGKTIDDFIKEYTIINFVDYLIDHSKELLDTFTDIDEEKVYFYNLLFAFSSTPEQFIKLSKQVDELGIKNHPEFDEKNLKYLVIGNLVQYQNWILDALRKREKISFEDIIKRMDKNLLEMEKLWGIDEYTKNRDEILKKVGMDNMLKKAKEIKKAGIDDIGELYR